MKSTGLALMAVGGLLFVFGLVDLIGSFGEFDLWAEIGVELPGVIWQYSAYIEILAGGALIKLGKSQMSGDSDDSDDE